MRVRFMIVVAALYVATTLSSCKKDDNHTDTTQTTVTVNTAVTVDPTLSLGDGTTYLWSVETATADLYALTDVTAEKPTFIAAKAGEYKLKLTALKNGQLHVKSINITVEPSVKTQSPYISKVFDYMPAVGQFVNDIPKYDAGNSKSDIIAKVEKYLVGKENGGLVSLGGFGGYIVFGFDHTVVNVSGKRDFRVMGNAFYSEMNPRPDAPKGGSCEPGIIMVSYDANHNGKPDDAWYEIAGSEYNKPTTTKKYEISYYKPQSEAPADPKKYIRWEDNKGNSGYKEKNSFHLQSYFPLWTLDDKITFSGTLLAPNGVDESGEGTYWVLYAYGYGYADNALNTEDDSAVDIDWAVNARGEKVQLPGIDFVKVYTGVNQNCGWIGENSTEIAGAYDLHLASKL